MTRHPSLPETLPPPALALRAEDPASVAVAKVRLQAARERALATLARVQSAPMYDRLVAETGFDPASTR